MFTGIQYNRQNNIESVAVQCVCMPLYLHTLVLRECILMFPGAISLRLTNLLRSTIFRWLRKKISSDAAKVCIL